MHAHEHDRQQGRHADRRAPRRPAGTRAGTADALLDLQARAGNAAVSRTVEEAGGAGTAIADRIRSAAGGGSALPVQPRQQLEQQLGSDLGAVRVHHGRAADSLAREMQAQAFTTGSDIFFRAGAYNPSTPGGLHLLAHEAVHTVQQRQGPVAGTAATGGINLSDPSDRFERAAETTAAQVVSRLSAP